MQIPPVSFSNVTQWRMSNYICGPDLISVVQMGSQRITARGLNGAQHLFLFCFVGKVLLVHSPSTHGHVVFGCFHSMAAELRDCITHKTPNIH